MAKVKKALHTNFEFPVVREKLIQSNGMDTGSDALFNGDNGEPISVVSRKYKVTSHKEVNDFAYKLFEANNINFTEGKTEVTHNGSKFYKEFIFPDYKIDPAILSETQNTALDGDPSTDGYVLRAILQNSYDRSKAFTFTFGAYRFVCSNGLVIGKTLETFRVRHNVKPNFEKLGHNFIDSAEKSIDWISTFFSEMNTTIIDSPTLVHTMASVLGTKLEKEATKILIQQGLMTADYNFETRRFENHSTAQSISGYLVYNVITELITKHVYGMHNQNVRFQKLNKVMMG